MADEIKKTLDELIELLEEELLSNIRSIVDDADNLKRSLREIDLK